jgi:hypothetical protein
MRFSIPGPFPIQGCGHTRGQCPERPKLFGSGDAIVHGEEQARRRWTGRSRVASSRARCAAPIDPGATPEAPAPPAGRTCPRPWVPASARCQIHAQYASRPRLRRVQRWRLHDDRRPPRGVPIVAHKIDKISGQIRQTTLPDQDQSIWPFCHATRPTPVVSHPASARPTLATS